MRHSSIRSVCCRLVALALSAAMLLPVLSSPAPAQAADRQLNLQQCVNLALQSSKKLTRQKSKILLKQMKKVEAIKEIKAKVKDLRTFRWTPLFGFKFPQPLKITNEYDMNIKPLVLQSEIDELVHQMDDIRFEVIQKTEIAYFDTYLLQEQTAFTRSCLEDARDQLKRLEAQVALGDATQSDADKASSSVDELEKQLSGQLKELHKSKEKLTDEVGMDVTSGYYLRNGYRTAYIPREDLQSLVDYTLGHDQEFYEAKMTESVARMNLDAYESLMRNQYGGRMSAIQNFINMSKQGMEVDDAAFQIAYDKMIKDMDRPWNGHFWILFFRFNKELFKGPIAGTRYIQDEMYAVFTACMEYAGATKDRMTTEKDLITKVKDTFENVIVSYNTYSSLMDSASNKKEQLTSILLLNEKGKATYEETVDAQANYQQAQQDALSALNDYNKLISDFDRLTWGAVSKYLSGTGMELDTGEGGDTLMVLDPIHDPYYYIYNSVADMTFNIGISIPDEFEPPVDSFEIWYENTQIGKRTNTNEELRHLVLDYGDTSMLTIRLYKDDEFVDECEINTAIPRDRLPIESSEPPARLPKVLGSYKLRSTLEGSVPMTELTMTFNATTKAKNYTLSYGNGIILTEEAVDAEETFHYMTLMIPNLEDITINLSTDSGDIPAYFDTETLQIVDMKPVRDQSDAA